MTLDTTMDRVRIGWSDERVEKLKLLWAEGLSASDAAARLGGVTRNAVIGKIHRLGLADRLHGRKITKRSRPRNQKPKVKPWLSASQRKSARLFTAEPFVPAPEIDVPLDERKGVLDLGADDCRWPIGDPQKPDFHFCNGKKEPGLPYCAHHCRVAFRPPEMRRKDVSTHFTGVVYKAVAEFFDGEAPIDTREKQDA